LQWAASIFGPGARVRSSRSLAGGTASAIHALTIDTPPGQVHRVVLRRYVRPDLLESEPYLAEREATALRFVGGSSLPTPLLLATDLDARYADAPALLMTRVPGHIEWQPRHLEMYLARLAEPLPQIHALPLPNDSPIPLYDPYELEMRRPPRWASNPDVWWKAIEVFDGPPPMVEHSFIHRDYHPGNVLWSRGKVSGVVDWC
jgi:aminoglycoside phosphotransferase (APT) family kinase protein